MQTTPLLDGFQEKEKTTQEVKINPHID